ncbi:hypothetical protein [Streptomyces sp. NPDC050848]|uniref:hypothetical protein n=1 Tax=Streptomyces sp. NPDC050848 TaxID=3155791 RepID=UPI0033C8595C
MIPTVSRSRSHRSRRSSDCARDRLSWTADRLPAARLVTIDTRHEIHRLCPDVFLAALRAIGIQEAASSAAATERAQR